MVISSSNNNNNEVILGDDEIDVANVLLDLPYLITNTLSSYRFSYDWGSKKRRSALVFPPSYSPPRCRRKVSAQLPPPPPPVKAEACSPKTPLSFSPSESDSKSVIDLDFKKKKQPPLNLRKKELEESLKEKMVTQQHLKESVDKVREYRNSLMVENSILKARRHELLMPACTTTTRMEQQQQQITTTVVNDRVHAIPSTSSEYHHQTLLIPSYDQRSPLISSFFQPNGGGNDWVHASPLHHQLNSGNNWGLQFQQYHNQSQPLILNHHGMVNDPVYAVAASGAMQMHCPAPLIPRHPNQRLLPDLNMEYKDQDQVCRERRAARLHANKEKRPRVNPAVK